MNKLDFDKSTVFGVIGVCGINGNLIARILSDHGYRVLAQDVVKESECKYASSLEDYSDIEIYYGDLPSEFFTQSDYIILPTALIESKSELYQKIVDMDIPILSVKDILESFEPAHPVICITGTNGKTTTVTLLKHIAYHSNITPCEHNLEGMQGNAGDIPALQSRLAGDVNILETGTFGIKRSLTKLASPCKPDVALITNITPDHLVDESNFTDYANVKGELIKLVENKTLIINSDDPTIKKLVEQLNYEGNLITFGLDIEPTRQSRKNCLCGQDVLVDEVISGVGRYSCECGLEYSTPDYIATNISPTHDKFTLKTPEGNYDFELSINGIHNIYNATGSIIVAHEILGIPYEKINEATKIFTGVAGRMEKLAKIKDMDVMIDYAHNPAGITTILKELKHSYDKVINVITTSSESGMSGDKEILSCALEYADYVVPASHNAYICAKDMLENNIGEDKIILPESMPEGDKEGTLGATVDQVLVGLSTALNLDANLLVCTG
ncbi:MAG: hypothetical protein LUG89_04685, partial [Methanosphaera sp.]|nr:hypothetical protein [Methanosphaera sp.]